MIREEALRAILALTFIGAHCAAVIAQVQPELDADMEYLHIDENFTNVENVSSLRNFAAADIDYVCRTDGIIQNGWAATGKATVGGCGSSAQFGFNAFRVVRLTPGRTYAICGSTQPVRTGWVIQQFAYGDACGTQNSTSYVNQIVSYAVKGQTYTVCSETPLPPGFAVINSRAHKPGCQLYSSHNAVVIR